MDKFIPSIYTSLDREGWYVLRERSDRGWAVKNELMKRGKDSGQVKISAARTPPPPLALSFMCYLFIFGTMPDWWKVRKLGFARGSDRPDIR